MPKVSVIIPSYNCEKYIRETIDCILAQTHKNIEVIVVDDGSTDNTQDIVASYGEPVRLIKQSNARVCAARNRGIQEANGEYICLMDHDDYWFPEKIARQIEILETSPEIGGVFSAFICWKQNNQGEFPAPDSYRDVSDEITDDIDPEYSGWIHHQLLLDCWILTSTSMFRAEVFQICGNFDVALPYSEDWDLWFRIAQKYQLIKLRRPTTLYRQHAEQGNRIVRDIDYRTTLLEKTVAKWGLCSQDGRCLDSSKFKQQLAIYHFEYAMSHLQVNHLRKASASLLKAWLTYPRRV